MNPQSDSDFERYGELIERLKEYEPFTINSTVIWRQLETIRNRHRGMPPKPPAAKTKEK